MSVRNRGRIAFIIPAENHLGKAVEPRNKNRHCWLWKAEQASE